MCMTPVTTRCQSLFRIFFRRWIRIHKDADGNFLEYPVEDPYDCNTRETKVDVQPMDVAEEKGLTDCSLHAATHKPSTREEYVHFFPLSAA